MLLSVDVFKLLNMLSRDELGVKRFLLTACLYFVLFLVSSSGPFESRFDLFLHGSCVKLVQNPIFDILISGQTSALEAAFVGKSFNVLEASFQ